MSELSSKLRHGAACRVPGRRGLQSSRKTLSQSMISHGMARNETQGAFDGMMADHTERFTTALKEESTRWQSCLNLLRAYPDVLTSNE